MSVTTSAPTREQLLKAIAALRAAGSTFHVLLEPDSAAGEFFQDIAHRLQDEFFGEQHIAGDEWMRDPIEVDFAARSAELEADALEHVQQHQALGERVRTLRTMGTPLSGARDDRRSLLDGHALRRLRDGRD
jgi:hypothetical protein